MELFDKKFVYLEWDDVLKGKKVVIGDTLGELKNKLHNELFVSVIENKEGDYPFTPSENDMNFAMAYYDPNYSCKRAYVQGKTIQCKLNGSPFRWEDCNDKPKWPVTHEELYCNGFVAGVKYAYDKLCEEQLKETKRTLNRVLNAFGSWKPEVKG